MKLQIVNPPSMISWVFQSPSKITEFSPSSSANPRALAAAIVSVSTQWVEEELVETRMPLPSHCNPVLWPLCQLCPKKWTTLRRNLSCKTQLAEQTSEPTVLVAVAVLVGWLSETPKGHHRHVEAPAQVGSQVVRSLPCCAGTIKSRLSLRTSQYHNRTPVLWTAIERSLSALNLVGTAIEDLHPKPVIHSDNSK